MNTDIDKFDTGSADAYLGMVRTYGKNVFSATLQYNQFWLDNDRYREAAGFTTQWQHNYSPNTQTSLYIQYAGLHYMTQEVRNTDRFVIGANFVREAVDDRWIEYYSGLETSPYCSGSAVSLPFELGTVLNPNPACPPGTSAEEAALMQPPDAPNEPDVTAPAD